MTDYQEFLLSAMGMTFEDYVKKYPKAMGKDGKLTLSTATLPDDIEKRMEEVGEI